jgi:hypothetical protein
MSGNGQTTVTRSDIEAKLQQIRDVTDSTAEVAQQTARPLLIAGGAVVLVAVFLLGRRAGRKRNTIVEVRRI